MTDYIKSPTTAEGKALERRVVNMVQFMLQDVPRQVIFAPVRGFIGIYLREHPEISSLEPHEAAQTIAEAFMRDNGQSFADSFPLPDDALSQASDGTNDPEEGEGTSEGAEAPPGAGEEPPSDDAGSGDYDRPPVRVSSRMPDQWIRTPAYDRLVSTLLQGQDVVLVGERGLGKSEMAVHACLEIYGRLPQVCTSPQVRSDVSGYPTADGDYVPSEVTRDIERAGMVLMEELDRCTPRASVYLNPILANRLATIPGRGTVAVHPMRRFVATMNTIGQGSDPSYSSAVRQDSALLDRFAVIKVEWDDMIALSCARDSPWPYDLVAFARAWNAAADNMARPDIRVSYRSITGFTGSYLEDGPAAAFDSWFVRFADPGTVEALARSIREGGVVLSMFRAHAGVMP